MLKTTKLIDLLNILESNNALKIYENSYIKNLDASYYDISAEIQIEGILFCGRGIDRDPNLSLKKSVFEAVERSLISHNHLETSNGVAISDSVKGARISAQNELCERHLFLYHWHNLRQFISLENNITKKLTHNFYKFFPKAISLNFYRTNYMNGSCCIISLVTGLKFNQPFGCIIGLGYNQDFEKSITHSFFETISSLSHEIASSTVGENYSIDQFISIERPTFRDHGKLAKNPEYYEKFGYLFPKSKSEIFTEQLKVTTDFTFTDLKIPVDCNLFGIQCTNQKFFKLYLGFASTEVKNNYPHFLD